jgi:hypothetical protein
MSEIEAKETANKRPVLLQDSVDPNSKDAKDAKGSEEPKGFWRRTWEGWRSVIIVVAALMVVRSVVADWNDVPTGSMKPTIMEGDRIFVNKLAYGLRFRSRRFISRTGTHPTAVRSLSSIRRRMARGW